MWGPHPPKSVVPDDPRTAGTLKRRASEAVGMSVAGLCQECEAATARYACDACGSAVCPDHYDDRTGLCRTCAGGGDSPQFRA